jgi:hypothetical protein
MVWTLSGLRGNRDAVKAAIATAKDVPAGVRQFLAGQVDLLPADVSACRLDAYCQDVESKQSMTLTRNLQVTLVSVKV